MNYGSSSGESSSGARENGAALSDSTDRPHKKARFPWQIKGKHHLKNQTDQLAERPTMAPTAPEPVIPPPETAGPLLRIPTDSTSSPSLKKEAIRNSIENAKRILRQSSLIDWNPPLPLETVISLAEAMLQQSGIDGSNLPATEQNLQNSPEQDLKAGPSTPVRTARDARRLRKAEDKCISRWQATQAMKGCFDNTINRVMETWMAAPSTPEDRLTTLDFIRIINEFPQNDDNIENEGILMAINAHGLQNVLPAAGGIPIIMSRDSLERTLCCDLPRGDDSDSSVCSEDLERAYGRAGGSPLVCNELDPENEIPRRAESFEYIERKQAAMVEEYNEYEFLNTAVIQAIKSKGLIATGTDFG